jgi:hypothetical protein
MWQYWRSNNVENARRKSDFAYECHLQLLADTTLDIFEQLTEQQKERPPAPSYTGPSELDLRIAKQCVKTRHWHFERLQKKFANRTRG